MGLCLDYAQDIAAQATDVINWINSHEKVRVVFDQAQLYEKALAYLVACITRWTTHFTAFACLLELKDPLSQSAFWKRHQSLRTKHSGLALT
jgi:hypothetical protein